MSTAVENFIELMNRKEDLHPDLVPHLHDGPVGQMLHHPLIINIIHHEMDNARSNAFYLRKREAVEKALAEGDYERYVFLHERPYRLNAFLDAIERGAAEDATQYWDILGGIWTDSENIHEHYEDWEFLWDYDVPGREQVMNEQEREALAALPDKLEVYRGIGHKEYVDGFSWTVDKDKAIWFARRFAGTGGRQPYLVTGTVSKEDVLAHFLGRGEAEIVALPEHVQDKKVTKL